MERFRNEKEPGTAIDGSQCQGSRFSTTLKS
jgi:hypothetical protein